jgi:hypothetical protein
MPYGSLAEQTMSADRLISISYISLSPFHGRGRGFGVPSPPYFQYIANAELGGLSVGRFDT